MAEQPKEIPKNLIQAIKSNLPMHVVTDYLRKNDKPVARNWDGLFSKNNLESDFFKQLLSQIMFFGRKSIFAYKADEVDLADLENLTCLEIDIDTALKSGKPHHQLINKQTNGRFTAYTFYCVKPAFEIYTLTKDDLSDSARKTYWSADSEIRVKTSVSVPVFDSLVYDAEYKVIYLLIDSLRYSFEVSDFDRQIELKNLIQGYCPSLDQAELLDFYSSIDEVYKKSSEGIVHKLSFECNTGALREEILRKGQLDLRQEIYHVKGKEAIGGKISPYKVGITWHPAKYKDLATEVDFEIKGTRKNLHQGGGVFNCAVNSAIAFDELCFALQRLVLYVDFS